MESIENSAEMPRRANWNPPISNPTKNMSAQNACKNAGARLDEPDIDALFLHLPNQRFVRVSVGHENRSAGERADA